MPYLSEHLLKLLQQFTRNPHIIKQVQALTITNGYLLFNSVDASKSKWTSTLLFNALIRCYLQIGQPRKTIQLFSNMLAHQAPPNNFTFTYLVKAVSSSIWCCTDLVGRALHSHVIRRGVAVDPFIQTSFISFYARYHSVLGAQMIFDEISEPCIVSHNAMLDVFAKSGDMSSALSLFECMPEHDVFSWTSVINGFGSSGYFQEAIRFFEKMMVHADVMSGIVRPNEATFASVLSSCSNIDGRGALYHGKQIHGYIIKNETASTVFIGTALISLYGKVGCLSSAMKVFERMETMYVCTWNAIICSLASNGMEQLAIDMFEKMKQDKFWPNEVTFVAILTACSRAKYVKLGLELFKSISEEFGIVPSMEHYGCVVDLLGRAGLLAEAYDFIKKMPFEPDDTVLGPLLGACKLHEANKIGNEVGKNLLKSQPSHCGKYVTLWNINAAAEKWDSATNLRRVMVEASIHKPQAFSLVDHP